eukprot:gene6440-16329_t
MGAETLVEQKPTRGAESMSLTHASSTSRWFLLN